VSARQLREESGMQLNFILYKENVDDVRILKNDKKGRYKIASDARPTMN